MRVPSTEVQNSFGKYLSICEHEEVIVTKKGKAVAKITAYRDCGEDVVSEKAAVYILNYQAEYQKYLELVENSDERYEFIDGEIVKLSSPSYKHQVIVSDLLVGLYSWSKGKKCRPLTSPFDVTLFKYEDLINVVQPDIIVICDTEKIDGKGKYKGVPTLVVEVLSRSTKKYDMLKKLDVYMQGGVKEYWIVNPDNTEVYIYGFKDNNIEEYRTYVKGSEVVSVFFEGLEIDYENIFDPQVFTPDVLT